MATIEQRYEHAVAYVHRAIDIVEAGPKSYDPITRAIDWYAGTIKTETTRSDLERLERQWMFATNDLDRARIAREAELLADRVKENLPGAPQDWKRTNLAKGEHERSTPATSYEQELASQASSIFGELKAAAVSAASGASAIGGWLLLGSGIVLAVKALAHLGDRSQRSTTERRLSHGLERAATRNARRPGRRRR